MRSPLTPGRVVVAAALLMALGTGARADLTNPSTLTLKEISPSRFTVELTLPVIEGRVLKARPVLPDVCVIEGDANVRGDGMKAVRTWTMTCDPDDLVGRPIGCQGLLGTAVDVQLTVDMLDGRKYVGQLRPTQAYFLIPPSPTLMSMAIDIGGASVRRVLRNPELVILLLLCVLYGLGLRGLLASAGAFAVTLALGQWLRTENWIRVSSFLPVMLAAVAGFAIALAVTRGRRAATSAAWPGLTAFMALTGVLYGGGGLPVETVLSRREQQLAFLFSALGAMVGLTLVVLCAGQLRALIAGTRETVRRRLWFWIAYLAGVAACAIGIYQATAPVFAGGVTPALPLVALVGAIALGAWCGTQSVPVRSVLPAVAGVAVTGGGVLGVSGIALPQTTLALHGSLALVGILLARRARTPAWVALPLVGISALALGARVGGVLRASAVLPVAQATALGALLGVMFLAGRHHATRRGQDAGTVRALGLATTLLAVLWRLAEYRDWIRNDLAVDRTIGLVPLPVLTIVLVLAALLLRPRRRRFQAAVPRKALPLHWGLALAALFTVPVAGVSVRNPLHEPRAPTADEARPVMARLLTDTYLAFNLPDENAAFDRLAENLSEDLVPGIYLDSRRRLTAGTRKGAEVTVKDVRVTSVEALVALDAADGSFTYPCRWVVTARVRHWQHVHDRQNVYVGTLTIRLEDDRWKISDLVLLSEEREVLSWKKS